MGNFLDGQIKRLIRPKKKSLMDKLLDDFID